MKRGYFVPKKSRAMLRDSVSDKILDHTEYLVVKKGVKNLTVSTILKDLNITNRVFYNRFHNIDEVLNIIYERVVLKMRENINIKPEPGMSYYDYVQKLMISCLEDTYDLKNRFSQYSFEHDSLSKSNYEWWLEEIGKLINYGIENGYIDKSVDVHNLSICVWCFCRGCNADAVTRNISRDEAIECMKAGFSYFIEGVKSKK